MSRKVDDVTRISRKSRIDILNMTHYKGAGFVGSDFSCVDILAMIYSEFLDDENDKLVLSKGHAAAAWYAVLANTGRIEKEILDDFNTSGKNLGVHPKRGSLPQIETSTGSLGQGVGLASGMALGEKMRGRNGKVFVIVGDGEANEGSVWETLMFAAKQNLDNLYLILDRNHLQSYGTDEDVLDIKDYDKKFIDFGWDTRVIDGHDFDAIRQALDVAESHKGKPHAIVAETVKGKGVKEFENGVIWHYKFPDGQIYEQALQELAI